MKVFDANKYQYVGQVQYRGEEYHSFRLTVPNMDPEFCLVQKARLQLPDGTSQFFDEIERLNPDHEDVTVRDVDGEVNSEPIIENELIHRKRGLRPMLSVSQIHYFA